MAAPMVEMASNLVIVVCMEQAQKTRHFLEQDGFWDACRRLQRIKVNMIAIPLKNSCLSAMKDKIKITHPEMKSLEFGEDDLASGKYQGIPCHIVSLPLPLSKKQRTLSPHQRLINGLMEKLGALDIPLPEGVEKEIPDVWEKHGDLILLPERSFCSRIWEHCDGLWEMVAMALGGQRVARKGRIKQDGFRTPNVDLLLGKDGVVEHRDNGIKYSYDIRHCMFSIGNITEKLRVAGFKCAGETVVDLYAGIGYFTLPYLVHAGASLLHACEWNPDAVLALKKNLRLNHVEDRCIVHQGDNRQVCPKGVADRVNLGLIPSSEDGWPVACAALNPHSGGVLHIHGNVTSHPTTKLTKEARRSTTENPVGSPTEDRAPVQGRVPVNITSSCPKIVGESAGSNPTGFGTANLHGPPNEDFNLLGSSVSLDHDLIDTDSGLTPEVKGHCTSHVIRTNLPEDVTRDDETSFQRATFDQAKEIIDAADQGFVAREAWAEWAIHTASRIHGLLVDIHGGEWTTNVSHVQHVKSYAPHVNHLVVDVRCRPRVCPTNDPS